MEKQNFEFGRIRSKYGIVNTFPYFGVLGHRGTRRKIVLWQTKANFDGLSMQYSPKKC
jgi:hypothetical protein